VRDAAPQTGWSGTNRRPAPDPAGAKRPPVAGRALAGGYGPRLVKDQPGAVAGAMAPAIEAVTVLSPLRAGSGNATRVSPSRAGGSPADRQVREERRPAPDPAGAKRPPGAGRALAGGCGPRLAKDQRGAVAGAMTPARAHGAGRIFPPSGQAACGAGIPQAPCRGADHFSPSVQAALRLCGHRTAQRELRPLAAATPVSLTMLPEWITGVNLQGSVSIEYPVNDTPPGDHR